MKGYKLKNHRDGINHITVLRHLEGNKYESVWKFSLEGDDNPISFLQFIHEEQFAVMNWDGWLRIYDLSSRKEVYNHNFEGSVTARAFLSGDGSRLYIKTGGIVNQLIIMRTNDHVIESGRALTFGGIDSTKHIQQYGNRLLFYSSAGRSPDWMHKYGVYDLEADGFSSFDLPHPQREPYNPAQPSLDAIAGIGIMPCWQEPQYREEDGDKIFTQQLMFFDLEAFKVQQILPVREVPSAELNSSNAKKSPEVLRALTSSVRDRSYDKAMQAFLYSLDSIVPEGDGKSCWLMWRNGSMRRVWYKGKLSPIYEPSTKMNSILRFSQEPDGFILHKSHDQQSLMHIADFDRVGAIHETEICQLDYSVPDNRRMQILNSLQAEEWDSERIYHVIPFAGVRDAASILAALELVVAKTAEGRKIKKGHLLCFLFKNKSRKTYEEKAFFAKAIKVKGAEKLMLQIAKNTLALNIDALYGSNNEDNALCHCFFTLLRNDPKHADLIFTYMDQIDLEHDSGNMEDFRELLIVQLGEEEFEKRLSKWAKLKEEFDSW